MIIVTGATGRLGSGIVERLLDRVPAGTVGVSVRDVDRAAALAERGVRVRAGDFTDPATLEAAFEGAEQVLDDRRDSLGARVARLLRGLRQLALGLTSRQGSEHPHDPRA